MALPASFSNIATNKTNATTIATDHPNHHNALGTSVNALEQAVAKTMGGGRVINVEMPPYNAVADDFYVDGVATSASTTFTSASAAFTGADVGKTIVILRAGVSNFQDNHTTIASVTNGTTVVLTHACGRTQDPAKFYISRGGDQTAAIQSAIDDATPKGGIVFCPGVGYLITGLVLKRRVTLQGAGHRATCLHLAASSNKPVVKNDQTLDDSADYTIIRDIWLDGNRQRQGADFTTTLGAGYTAGNNTITLTSSAGLQPIGSILIGTNRLHYSSISGNTLNGVTGGAEGTTDASASNGATVTQHQYHGVFLTPNPYNSVQTGAEHFDPHHRLENVTVKNCKGVGFELWGQSDIRVENCVAHVVDHFGFRASFDTTFTGCTSDNVGRAGYFARSSQVRMSGCASFYSGQVTAAEGHGYFFEGPVTIEEGGKSCSAMSAQDNKAHGVYIRNAQRIHFDGVLSSNSTSSAGTYVGAKLEGATNCILDLVTVERFVSATQLNAIEVQNTAIISAGNQVRVSHGGAQGVTVGTALKSGSTLSTGNNITVNAQGSFVQPTFASPYTPDPYVAKTHQLTLTGPLTINAPANAHLGTELRFVLVQDATGNRVTTFNSALPAIWAPSLQPGSASIIEFVYNGTVWVQVIPTSDAPVRKTVLADVSDSTTATATTLTDLDMAVAANTDYQISYLIWYGNVAATTTAPVFDVTAPTGANVGFTANIPLTTTTIGVAYSTASAGTMTVATTPAISQYYVARIDGFVRTGATAGTVSLRFNPDAAASITVRRGSQALMYVG